LYTSAEQKESDKVMIKNKKATVLVLLLSAAVIAVAVLTVLTCKNKGSDSEQTESPASGMFTVETPYVNLQFPQKWEKDLVIEKNEILTEGDVYRLEVYYAPEGKDMIHLFDISFGELNYCLGTINSDGIEIKVDIDNSYELPEGGDYSTEELDAAANMKAYYSEIIEYLQSLENFSFS